MKPKTALLLLTMLLASACATSGPAVRPGCEWTKTIWLDPADKLTRRTEDAILEHNETREKVCGR